MCTVVPFVGVTSLLGHPIVLQITLSLLHSGLQDEELLLHAMGTAAVVVQVTGTNWPKPLYTLLVTGLCRFRIDKTVMEEPYLIAEVSQLDRPTEQGMYNDFLSRSFG